MKKIFRKYINSVLHPDEYTLVSDFLADKKNEPVIFDLIKPFWDRDMQEETEVPKPNPELREKILQTIRQNERNLVQRKLKLYRFAVKIAAVLVVGLVITTAFFFRKSARTNDLASIQEPAGTLQTISAPYGAKTNLTLPDGSSVWLNSGSSLSFNTKFGKDRLVTLKGEAFFEVRKNGTPFIVSTKDGEIEVRGTTFNVKDYEGETLQTTLLEGVVKVRKKYRSEEVLLEPGQQAGIFGTELKVKNVDTDLYSSWKDGKLIFRNEYLPEVAKRLERWYNVKIELANDKRLSEISYTGTLEMESFSEVLQLLKVTAPIDFSYNEKTRTIRIIYVKN